LYVLYPKDPSRCQINKEWRFHNEVQRVRSDKYLIVHDFRFRDHLKTRGWREVENALVDKNEAAELLGVPIPVVNRWFESGKLKEVKNGLLFRHEVEELAEQREDDPE